jgi:hypothetical protein
MCFDLLKPKPTLTNNINNQKLMGKKHRITTARK